MNQRLELSAEEMRQIGYRVVDSIVRHLSTLSDQPVGSKGDPATLLPRFDEPPPEHGVPFPELLDQLEREVLSSTMHVNHPRFFAYVPGPSNFIGAMADALISGYNVFAGTWISGSGAAAVELATVSWLRGLCGFPQAAGGLFVSGGTMANLTALAVARRVILHDRVEGAVVYLSDQGHSSLEKTLHLLGFAPESVRKVSSGDDFRLRTEDLAQAVAQDRAAGRRPACIIASAGTTNTGAIDPLPEIAALAREHEMWLHVDGAYGAAAVLCQRGRDLLRGIHLADSLSFDPHKWLFQPFETGCVLVRDANLLRDTFQVLPEYLKDTHLRSAEINLTDYGVQLTRNFRALKLWLSLKYFGLDSFRAAIEHGFELAEFTQTCLRKMPGWEIVTPAQMGIVCFRHHASDDAGHLELVQKILRDGFALVTSTILRGRTVLRMCPINPRSTEADVEETLKRLDRFAREG
jgi:glutamate/tyrosine decarboxylase-like PLP-dependent enzyme